MSTEQNNLIYWKCATCNSVQVSDPKKRWSMNMCSCGESGVDAEEYYTRMMGNVVEITKEEWEAIKK